MNRITIQTRLLEQPDLTFDHAMQTALAMEAVKKDAGEICQASFSSSAFTTHRVTTGRCHLQPLWRWTRCVQLQACEYRKRGHLLKVCNSK